uniref:Uncharacterized protein n=1 Tax=Ditylenchus dipsaci TaxID=166011 RepID=A0A915D3U9_9BILA
MVNEEPARSRLNTNQTEKTVYTPYSTEVAKDPSSLVFSAEMTTFLLGALKTPSKEVISYRARDPSPPFHQSNLVTEKNKEPPDPLEEDLAFNRGDSDVEDNPEDRIYQEWKMADPGYESC